VIFVALLDKKKKEDVKPEAEDMTTGPLKNYKEGK